MTGCSKPSRTAVALALIAEAPENQYKRYTTASTVRHLSATVLDGSEFDRIFAVSHFTQKLNDLSKERSLQSSDLIEIPFNLIEMGAPLEELKGIFEEIQKFFPEANDYLPAGYIEKVIKSQAK